ncbi:MAG: hypothetical protein RLZZ519_2378 [Bacteroidota bacterium]|jgi:hypothetical protein
MSYDIKIKVPQGIPDVDGLRAFIDSLPDVADLRYRVEPHHYMEIDLERLDDEGDLPAGLIDCISFHIPFAFMDHPAVNPELYFEIILRIARHVGARAYDLQKDLYLDDPQYNNVKRRQVVVTHPMRNAVQCNGNSLTFTSTTSNLQALIVDLADGSIQQSATVVPATDTERTFHWYRAAYSHDGSRIAVAYWKEKVVKLYATNGAQYVGDDALGALWKTTPMATIDKTGQIVGLQFSSDDKHLFTAAYRNATLKRWDVKTQKLICNYTSLAKHTADFAQVSERLLVICSGAGIGFFDAETGAWIVHIRPLPDNWLVFCPNGDYEFQTPVAGAIELDYIDAATGESVCFIPDCGFGNYERSGKFELKKLKPTTGIAKTGLLKSCLEGYV